MPNLKHHRLAKQVQELRISFEMALSNKRKYPRTEFEAYYVGVRRYIEALDQDPLIHRDIVREINGLREYLEVERRRVPDDVIWKADRLECLVFLGYDPHFEGHEPPDC